MTILRLILVLIASIAWMVPAVACYVKGPGGSLNVRNAPNGLVVGSMKNGILVVIEEVDGDWVSITPHAKRSETPVWVRYSELDCNSVDDVLRKAERAGKTPQQFADELLRKTKPVRRTDEQLRTAALTVASRMVLKNTCKVPLTYGEQVETIVIGTQVGRARLNEALKDLNERKDDLGASEFCLRLEKALRNKVEW